MYFIEIRYFKQSVFFTMYYDKETVKLIDFSYIVSGASTVATFY